MDGIRNYILSVVAASVISSILVQFVNQKTSHGMLIKMIAGLYLAITVVSPLAKIKLFDITSYVDAFDTDGEAISLVGKSMADDSLRSIIKEQTESYILRKASSLKLDVNVDVALTQDEIPVPRSVKITGRVSPYGKAQLQHYIVENIGISEDNQIWN